LAEACALRAQFDNLSTAVHCIRLTRQQTGRQRPHSDSVVECKILLLLLTVLQAFQTYTVASLARLFNHARLIMVLPDKQFEELYNAFTTYNSKAKAKANAKQKH